MHICPDEVKAVAAALGSFTAISLTARWCWAKLCSCWRKS